MNEEKFSGLSGLYAQYRPDYPQALMEYLYTEAGLAPEAAVADVGAGTGIFTKQLLEKGSRVWAVEPNADMRASMQESLGDFPRLSCVSAPAEHTGLAAGSVDFVTAAQAFHWFDRAAFKAECRRILKPRGRVVLVWNSRDAQSALVRENAALNRAHCPAFRGFSGGLHDNPDFSDFFEGAYIERRFENPLYFDESGFLGRNLSASYAPRAGDPAQEKYVEALRALFARYSENGVLKMPNITRCYVGAV